MAKKKPRVRTAKARDKGLFRKLWMKFLEDNAAAGYPMTASKQNLDAYTNVFERYVNNELEGIVLFIAQNAVVMAGADGSPIEHVYEKPAQGWGIYVDPDRREDGLGSILIAEVVKRLKSLGFSHLIGSTTGQNVASDMNMQKAGFKELPIKSMILEIKE